MPQVLKRLAALASFAMVGTMAAIAHPGHDHDGAGHEIHEMPSGADAMVPILLGGLALALIIAAVHYTRQRPQDTRRSTKRRR